MSRTCNETLELSKAELAEEMNRTCSETLVSKKDEVTKEMSRSCNKTLVSLEHSWTEKETVWNQTNARQKEALNKCTQNSTNLSKYLTEQLQRA